MSRDYRDNRDYRDGEALRSRMSRRSWMSRKMSWKSRASRALAALRDALLPRLMSGEIDVSEVAV